jgi:hypothetical protein
MGIFNFFKKKNKTIIVQNEIQIKEPFEIIMEIDEYLNKTSNYGRDLSRLNSSQQLVLIIGNLVREINNGGFNQFYFNSSGAYAQITSDYLRKIKAIKTACLVKKANLEWPENKVPFEQKERQAILSIIENKAEHIWEDCDQQFYKCEDDLERLLVDFVNDNRADFDTHP